MSGQTKCALLGQSLRSPDVALPLNRVAFVSYKTLGLSRFLMWCPYLGNKAGAERNGKA